MTKDLEVALLEPKAPADASVIWLHGLGADNGDFIGVVDQLGLPVDHTVRFIFPNAPLMSVTVNHGMKMRGWYDIYDINLLRKEDEAGVINSQQLLTNLINREIQNGIDSRRIILAGFSQGGAISLYTGLRASVALGGILALSAYLPVADSFVADDFLVNREIPIFMAHGLFDPVVPLHAAKSTAQLLIDSNYNLDFKTYPMAHTVVPQEISDIGAFINRCLAYA